MFDTIEIHVTHCDSSMGAVEADEGAMTHLKMIFIAKQVALHCPQAMNEAVKVRYMRKHL